MGKKDLPERENFKKGFFCKKKSFFKIFYLYPPLVAARFPHCLFVTTIV
jgi:hypothetical protein